MEMTEPRPRGRLPSYRPSAPRRPPHSTPHKNHLNRSSDPRRRSGRRLECAGGGGRGASPALRQSSQRPWPSATGIAAELAAGRPAGRRPLRCPCSAVLRWLSAVSVCLVGGANPAMRVAAGHSHCYGGPAPRASRDTAGHGQARERRTSPADATGPALCASKDTTGHGRARERRTSPADATGCGASASKDLSGHATAARLSDSNDRSASARAPSAPDRGCPPSRGTSASTASGYRRRRSRCPDETR